MITGLICVKKVPLLLQLVSIKYLLTFFSEHLVVLFSPGTTDILRGGEGTPLPTYFGPLGGLFLSRNHGYFVGEGREGRGLPSLLLGSLSVEELELFECFHRYTVDTVLGPHPHLVASGSLPLSNLDGHMKDLPSW